MEPNGYRCKNCPDKSCAVAQLNDHELTLLSQNVVEMNFAPGDAIFWENAPNAHVVYLKKGLVKLYARAGEDKEYILKIVTAPSYLGLSTILGDRLNRFSAMALEPVSVCFINFDTFKHLIRTNGNFAYEIVVTLSKDELCIFRQYVNQTHKQTPGRLAGALLFFAEEVYRKPSFDLALTRQELAELIGVSRENISRHLSQFQSDGIISLHRNHISILHIEALQRIHAAG